MSNKKRIQKKIQSIENKNWFREVSFAVKEGFPNIIEKLKEVAMAIYDFTDTLKNEWSKIILQSRAPIVSAISYGELNKAYSRGKEAGEKWYLEYLKKEEINLLTKSNLI